MKPARPAVSGRTPYAERDNQINEFCSCHYLWSEGTDGNPRLHERMWRDPNCKLHGAGAKEAPY